MNNYFRLSEMYGNEKHYQPSMYRSNFPDRNHNEYVDDKAKRIEVKKESADHPHNETSEDKDKRNGENQRLPQEPYSEGYMGGRLTFHHSK